MDIDVTLNPVDIDFLDRYARDHGLPSRSAALERAVWLLRTAVLGPAYEAAWQEWASAGDAGPWESTAFDGVSDR
jgi:hypothetical protein